MEINKTNGISGPGGVDPTRAQKPSSVPPQAPVAPSRTDQVDISYTAQLISQVTSTPGVRQDLVQQLKQEILSGRYETPERLEKALEKFMSENTDLL